MPGSRLTVKPLMQRHSPSLSRPLFVGIARINTRNVRVHIQSGDIDAVQKTQELTSLSSIKTFCWRHISGRCSRFHRSETKFLSASVPRWMDGWMETLFIGLTFLKSRRRLQFELRRNPAAQSGWRRPPSAESFLLAEKPAADRNLPASPNLDFGSQTPADK